MITITGGGAFTRQNIIDLNANFGQAGAPFTPGNLIYCNVASTNLGQPADGSAARPFTDIVSALGAARNGMNDIILLVSDGGTGASVRPTSTLVWSKNATHLVGYSAPSNNTRARIATLSGNTAFANFVKVTATGCTFQNFSLFSGENLFVDCTFGVDTIARSAANATIEFAGNSKRNVFINCKFITRCTASTPIHMKSSGTNPLETYQLFVNPVFWNEAANGSGTTLAAVATLAASGNGNVVLVNPSRFLITDWGTDATSLAQIYVDGAATGATDDIGRGAVAIAT